MRILSLSAIIAATLLAVSCKWDDTIIYREVTMAEFTGPTQLKTDAGLTYNIVEKSFEGSLEGLTRVLVLCDVVKETGEKQYDVKLRQLVEPLKKDPVKTSTLTKPDDGLGNDPIAISKAWISGGYLNLGIAVVVIDQEKDHTINLEFDDTAPMDTLRFTLRHDDSLDDDIGAISADDQLGSAYATFPIRQLLPEGVNTLPVKLTWTWDKEYTVKDGLKL